MMNVVIYARKGSDPETDYLDLNSWAEKNNALVHKRFGDTSSGTSKFNERLPFSEAIVAAKIFKCEAILVKDIQTIGRDQETVFDILNACFRNNIGVMLAREGILAEKNMNELASMAIMNSVKEEEEKMNNTIKGMKRGRKKARKNGVHMGRKKGSIKSDEDLLNEYSNVIDLLQQGVSIRKTAKALEISPGTVQKVKNKFINSMKDEN